MVQIRETVQEITIPQYVPSEQVGAAQPALFAGVSDEDLLSYGVPPEWLEDVRRADEDTILELVEHLPGEASEALLELATGGKPEIGQPMPEGVDPFAHPDAQRRFRVMGDVDELKRVLEFPWDQWTVFLHPSQRRVVEQVFNGPARVSGSAGTGKTVVAIHRAANILKKNADAKLLLTTFSLPLANALESKVKILTGDDKSIVPRVTVLPFRGVAQDLFTLAYGYHPRAAPEEQIRGILESSDRDLGVKDFTTRFLVSEWTHIVDAWEIETLEADRDADGGRDDHLHDLCTFPHSLFVCRQLAVIKKNLKSSGFYDSLDLSGSLFLN